MPKQDTEKPPPARDPIFTYSRTQTSMSGEKTMQGSNAIPATHANEQRTPKSRYILVSPTLGPITVEQLLKGNSNNISQIQQRFAKGCLQTNNPQTNS